MFYLKFGKTQLSQNLRSVSTRTNFFQRHDIVVYQEINQPPRCVTDNGFKDKVCDVIFNQHFIQTFILVTRLSTDFLTL